MDVESPEPPPTSSTSSVAPLRKRSFHPSDVNNEGTLICSTASDESSDESEFVHVARRMAKRRLLKTFPSQSNATPNIQEPPVHTISFVPLNAADSMNRLNRHVTSMSLEALVPGQIPDVRINGHKKVLAIDATQRTALEILTKVNVLGNINVRSFIPDDKDSRAGVIYDVDTSVSVIDFPNVIKTVMEPSIIFQARRLENSRCVKLVFKGDKASQAEHRKSGNRQGPHEASSKQCPNVKEMQVLRQMARYGSTQREAADKVRRRRSRYMKTPRVPSAKARDTPLPHITHSPPQAYKCHQQAFS
ncbi:hypothetical protein HPB51_007559 [Rhipicephalus microplus]|uniref:Uncharacterized protein n=1 Tax=Rhipicephalus microplus TaxID=6941 RepID=A0A9J6D4X5_RHIMP|nr:hypothetical protein HPB51_007559 [Rhipicephalus microplus]